MKKILSFVMVAVLAVMLGGCQKYDDTDLRNKVNGYESRIAALESLASYQALLQALNAGNTVVGFSQSGNEITLAFSNGDKISFNQQGESGADAIAPQIKNEDGQWKISTDGGQTWTSAGSSVGTPGKDGKTPEFKIENEKWYVRYSNDDAWKEVGSAIDRSLIQNVVLSDDGKTLLITLAGGTVFPVSYGTEPSGRKYNLTIADGKRKVFSMWEDLEWVRSFTMKIPYTLEGNIANASDVSIDINVVVLDTNNEFALIMPKIEAIDANTGYIILPLGGGYPDYGYPLGYDMGVFYFGTPTIQVKVVAYFPDGTSSFSSFFVLRNNVTLISNDSENISYDSEDDELCLNLPSSSGTLTFEIDFNTHGWYSYDGARFPEQQFSDVFTWYYNGYYEDLILAERITSSRFYNLLEYAPSWWGVAKYSVEIDYSANTTGAERIDYLDLDFCKYYFYVKLVQAK
ncbi:MAG: hypothetical protein IKX71_06700 [Bacteroidales bacterium]|nr:hypothetical protein [Bacteroidales bacterium]